METEVPSVNRVDEIHEKARQSYQYVDVLTGTVELFDAETGERLFDYVAAVTEE